MTSGPESRRILFVCESGSGKSRLAAAHMIASCPNNFEVSSAGTSPGRAHNPLVAEALDAVGLEAGHAVPQPLTLEAHMRAELVVMLGSSVQLEELDGPRYERWILEEPSLMGFHGAERMALIRDEIGARVRELLGRLGD